MTGVKIPSPAWIQNCNHVPRQFESCLKWRSQANKHQREGWLVFVKMFKMTSWDHNKTFCESVCLQLNVLLSSSDLTIYTPGIGTLNYTVSSPLGRIQHLRTLVQLGYSQSLQFSFLVPPGTYHCWVDRGGVIWEVCLTPLHITWVDQHVHVCQFLFFLPVILNNQS